MQMTENEIQFLRENEDFCITLISEINHFVATQDTLTARERECMEHALSVVIHHSLKYTRELIKATE